MIDRPDDLVGERGGIAFRHDHRIVTVGQDVEQPVGVGRDNRLPHRERFEAGERRPFPERRKHAEVERRQRAGTSRRKPAKTNRSPSPSAAACAWRSGSSGPSPTRKNRAAGRCADDRAAASTRYAVPLRLVEPRDRADRELVRADAELLARQRDLARRSASRLNSSSGTPRYTTFTFDGGTCRAPITKSAVLFDTASAMSVYGSSSRSATF